jgi:pyridinium-3,5-biscarboxylic acid mononucleotide sulfurtransferase
MPSLADLEARVATVSSAIVAFSGGVDSSLVAAAAAGVLGERAVAVTALSPALAAGELDGARAVADAVGIGHRAISTDELARAGYRANGPDRCYHCKSELYDRLAEVASAEGYAAVFSGANVDDLGDVRPGLRAAAEHHVRHPLVEAGFRKVDIRRVALELSLPSADKPAMPCLASRVPFGTAVDPAMLAQIDRAERALRELGYRDLRVRHLGEHARVELGDADLEAAANAAARAQIEIAVVAAGYRNVTIDDRPLRSGSFAGRRALTVLTSTVLS